MAKQKEAKSEAELTLFEKLVKNEVLKAAHLVNLGSKVGKPLPSIITNLPTLDWGVLQCGGIPQGRIIELFGPESAGKTTIALHIVAQAQKQFKDKVAAFVDAEHALDPTYAKKLGVDVDNLVVQQPDNGEQALEVTEALVESGLVSVIVVDSVAALVPKAELEGDMGDSHMGLQARLMSQAMRKLTGICSKNNVTIIFINQIREKIGVMFGSPETTTGGRALKFYASVRIDVRRREVIGEKERPEGHWLELKAVKNKAGAPFRSTKIKLMYNEIGLDTLSDFVQYCIDLGAVIKPEKSTWYQDLEGNTIGQGVPGLMEGIASDSELRKRLEKDVERIRLAEVE